MNYRALSAMATAVILAACAGRTDCTRALELAGEAARGQQPPGAWIERIDGACSDAAMHRWTDAVSAQCAPVFGFHAGLTGADSPAECDGAGFQSAWNLGEMIAGMRNEIEEIERRLADDSISPGTRRELERRLVVIGRDLPQVEALARMDGYLPPAEVPDSDQGTSE